MRQAYIKHLSYVCSGSADLYLEDVRVKPGEILVIRNLVGSFVNQATSEVSQFFVRRGPDRLYLGEKLPLVTSGMASWSGKALAGEGDQIGVYLPNIGTGEVGHLYIFGELWDLDEWQACDE